MAERIAIITGGAGDLAQATAAELSRAGFVVDAPAREALDVSNAASVQDYFAGRDRIDLLINNAGNREDALCASMTPQQWDSVIATNLRGAFLCSQAAALKMMRQRSGHIVNIGSFAARIGNAGQPNYAAAKAGLIGLTQSMARELGKRNVRVNCVLPGFLETKFSAGMPPQFKQHALEMHELGKFNTMVDAARFIAFLETMSAVSGQVFQLDSRIAPWT
ncbi:MAG TPA: SDR family NAD(P)-dependent oxidoreductase [Chthoniobacterales bacterium]